MKILKAAVRLWLGVALAAVSLRVVAAPSPDTGTNRIVVMISVDGLAAFYFDDAKAEMPTIRALAQGGAHAAMMKAVAPTVTWPNHTTLVTGVNPAKHGVVGNNYYDRAANRTVVLIADPEFDKDQIVKVPTLYDLAKAQGWKTAAIRWPATRNARTLDWTIPDMKNAPLAARYSTPSLLVECAAAGLSLSPRYEHHDTMDELCTDIFNHILREHQPTLALLHLINVDHTQHSTGPRTAAAYAAIKEADRQVKEVWDLLQRDYPGRATLFVVSDHGFSPINRTILPNVVLRQAGIATGTNSPVQVVVQGGAAMIYARETAGRAALLEQVRQAFAQTPSVAKIIGPEQFPDYGVANPKDDPHAPDLILFAEEGCAFGNTASGDEPFKDKKETSGTHGHDPHLPNLHATFVAWGAGIKPGAKLGEISNTSVAPTIAHLLGLKIPDADGPVLTPILAE